MTDQSQTTQSNKENKKQLQDSFSQDFISNNQQHLIKPLVNAIPDDNSINPKLLTPDAILHLQRTIGNHATRTVLKRVQRNPIVADKVLNAAQVDRAQQFYTTRKHQYTPENVRKIQEQLGIAQTQVADEAFIQAVARFQQTNGGLIVDGMAGKNTIAEVFPNGMLDYDRPSIAAGNEELLTDAQVVTALSFYAQRPALYPSAVIKKIQEQVGAEPTGKMNPETVQAVARFQKNDGSLAIDGMAGPRTMPAAFPTGLAKESSMTEFAQGTIQLEEEWDKLASESDPAKARAELMLKNANEQLIAANVPPVTLFFGDTKGAKGLFAPWMWAVWVKKEKYTASAAETDITDLGQIFYHEARHAEQNFNVARLQIGKGHSIEQVMEQTGIKRDIIEKAAEIPIIPGTPEAVSAEGWFQSKNGTGEQKREKVLATMAKVHEEREIARAKHKRAKEEHDKQGTPETKTALENAEKELTEKEEAYAKGREDYENLPEEADTHRVARKYVGILRKLKEEKQNQ